MFEKTQQEKVEEGVTETCKKVYFFQATKE